MIDEETRWVVEKIFDLAAHGCGAAKIARVLYDEMVPTPAYWHYMRQGKFDYVFADAPEDKAYSWSLAIIRAILNDETYIGNTIHHKQSTISYKNKKVVQNPKEEWVRVENMHEPIISKDLFDQVQEQIATRRRMQKDATTQIFAGLLKCADCGWSMTFARNANAKNPFAYGASASIYWDGKNVTWCYIKGVSPAPQPVYGSMSGTCCKDTASTVYVVLANGSGLHRNGYLVNIVSGDSIDGAPCVVYYTDYPSESSIYSIDVYGFNTYYDQGGWAGSQYYNNGWGDNDYTYGDTFVYDLHNACNPDGSSYNTVTCPNCGNEVSMAYDNCPYCGFPLWS